MMEVDKHDTANIKLRNKAINIINTINKHKIDMNELRKLAFTGIPSGFPGLR
jgi:hypothetical protein